MTSEIGPVALVACSNGYGHTRRMLLLAQRLAAAGAPVQIFAPRPAVSRLIRTLDIRPAELTFHDFETGTSVGTFGRRVEDLTAWVWRLPDLDQHVVVSDNLPEILSRFPSAILSGSFHWHKTLDGVDAAYRTLCEELLSEHRPTIVSSELWTTPYLQGLPGIKPVGLYGSARQADAEKTGLLISGGATGDGDPALIPIVAALCQTGLPKSFREAFVEPRLLPPAPPAWMKPAKYAPPMFDGLIAAVIRPGLGTVTECLTSNVWIVSVHEPGNRELEFNVDVLSSKGLGVWAKTPSDAISLASLFAEDAAARSSFYKSVEALSWTGAQDACSVILDAGRQALLRAPGPS